MLQSFLSHVNCEIFDRVMYLWLPKTSHKASVGIWIEQVSLSCGPRVAWLFTNRTSEDLTDNDLLVGIWHLLSLSSVATVPFYWVRHCFCYSHVAFKMPAVSKRPPLLSAVCQLMPVSLGMAWGVLSVAEWANPHPCMLMWCTFTWWPCFSLELTSPREPHARAWGPSCFHTKSFRVERERQKISEKIDDSQ